MFFSYYSRARVAVNAKISVHHQNYLIKTCSSSYPRNQENAWRVVGLHQDKIRKEGKKENVKEKLKRRARKT
jgi:hypothetical protein